MRAVMATTTEFILHTLSLLAIVAIITKNSIRDTTWASPVRR